MTQKEKSILIVAGFLLFFTVTSEADWTVYRGQVDRDAYNPSSETMIPKPNGTISISGIGVTLSQPIRKDQFIYVGTSDGKIVKVDITSVAVISNQYQTGGPVSASAIIIDGILYCGSQDGYFYAINAADMTLKWRIKATASISASALCFNDGVILTANYPNT